MDYHTQIPPAGSQEEIIRWAIETNPQHTTQGVTSNYLCHILYINKYTSVISRLRKKLEKEEGLTIVANHIKNTLYGYTIEPTTKQRRLF